MNDGDRALFEEAQRNTEGCSELAFARAFHARHVGGAAQVWRTTTSEWSSGLVWLDGEGWVAGDAARTNCRARMADLVEARCMNIGDDAKRLKAQARWGSNARVGGALTLAASMAGVFTPLELWDADPNLLGLPDCHKLDLSTGVVSAQLPDDLISRRVPVEPDPNCPTPMLDRVLAHMADGDERLAEYYQTALGMSLFGHNDEALAFFWYGDAASGKTTILSAAKAAFGTYGGNLNRETLEGERSQHLTFVNALRGKRLAVVAEMEGEDLKAGRFKLLTGGDEMLANPMRMDPSPMRCDATFHVMANPECLPTLKHPDESMRRRIRIVPAGASVPEPERDPMVRRRMMAEEQPGILAWTIEGARHYANHGLDAHPAVTKATKVYFEQATPVGRWIEERCETGSYEELAGALYADFEEWWKGIGIRKPVPAQQSFARTLTSLGYEARHSTVRKRVGLKLKPKPGTEWQDCE